MTENIHCSPESLNRSYAAAEIEHQRQVTMAALSVQPGQSALDVGCGSGFLTLELAKAVGEKGSVWALDISEKMCAATVDRCRHLPQVTVAEGSATCLNVPPAHFDVVACTQVLLYVEAVEQALTQMVSALRPGGRLAVLETDWRGVVMHSNYPELTEGVYRAWDDTVPSPHLPVRLRSLMCKAGLESIQVTAIPLLNEQYDPGSFSVSSLDWLAHNAVQKGAITREESHQWRNDLEGLRREGAYFFCVNRFLFIGHKP